MANTKRVPTGTFLGSCSGGCGTVKVDRLVGARHTCGSYVTACSPIKARVTEHECGPRCTSALGPVCDCTCGGENHGADHH